MNTENEQHKKQQQKQIAFAILGFIAILIYVYISIRDNWPLYVILSVVAVLGVALFFAVKSIKKPILCSGCKMDMRGVYDDAENKSYSVNYCPNCGLNIENVKNT